MSSRRVFFDITGNEILPDNMCGYCKYHRGMLSYKQMELHGCKHRLKGDVCDKLILFEYKDPPRSSKLYGDAYRKSLKRKKK